MITNFQKLFPVEDKPITTECYNFIKSCLEIDPVFRPTIEDLSKHKFLENFTPEVISQSYYFKFVESNNEEILPQVE